MIKHNNQLKETTAMISRRMIAAFLLALALAGGLGSIGCGKKQEEAAGPTWKPAGNEGNITGAISFTGQAPAPRKLDTSNDKACGEVMADDVLVNDGKLQNVFVFVKSGLPEANFEIPATPVTFDQNGCKYLPRVFGIQTGQPLSIVNSDPTNHNVHFQPKINREGNESQLKGQAPITKKFTKPETLILVKCNMHSWMTAYIGVLPHPFYAVSAADGTFTIKGLPPGDYEIEAWHEKYGAKTLKVKVAEKADAKADFSFDAATAFNAGSLKVQPALVLP
jgi:plastocyanin